MCPGRTRNHTERRGVGLGQGQPPRTSGPDSDAEAPHLFSWVASVYRLKLLGVRRVRVRRQMSGDGRSSSPRHQPSDADEADAGSLSGLRSRPHMGPADRDPFVSGHVGIARSPTRAQLTSVRLRLQVFDSLDVVKNRPKAAAVLHGVADLQINQPVEAAHCDFLGSEVFPLAEAEEPLGDLAAVEAGTRIHSQRPSRKRRAGGESKSWNRLPARALFQRADRIACLPARGVWSRLPAGVVQPTTPAFHCSRAGRLQPRAHRSRFVPPRYSLPPAC